MELGKEQKKSINSGLRVVADIYALQIIDQLRITPLGFNQLQRNLDNVSPTTLSSKLKSLLKIHLIEAHRESNLNMYQLTKTGKKALPIIDALNQFMLEADKSK